MRSFILGLGLCSLALPLAASADPATPKPRHDWQAPLRWVHFDNQDSSDAHGFESARKTWLATLARDGSSRLDDGRPLIWESSEGVVHTWITLYPFAKYADLDARRETVAKTQMAVGEAAVVAYDAGDTALVAPHFTEIWRRSAEDDYVPAGTNGLDELTAGAGYLEVRRGDPRTGATADELWKKMRAALAAANYPLTCRAYSSVYGQGQWIFFWLAESPKALAGAPNLKTAVHTQRDQVSMTLPTDFERAAPVISRRRFVRRADLSNL